MGSKDLLSDWRHEEASRRLEIIVPLLDDTMDPAEKSALRKELADKNGIAVRTLYRYENSYKDGGFAALLPMERLGPGTESLPDNYEQLVAEAEQLKREQPRRSVAQIIRILEGENKVAKGVLKRSTLQARLFQDGYGRNQMLQYVEARDSSRKRYCKPHRMMLVQADIKYGCYLPIGKNGAMSRTYLSTVIDDHSRYVLSSRFYDNQKAEIVQDTFKQAILSYGKFDLAYVDNGRQYLSLYLKKALESLGISVRHAPPRSGKSKGLVERFHGSVVDPFLNEVKLQKVQTLDELNQLWGLWLYDYHHRAHDGIREYYESQGVAVPPEGISPLQEFNRDTRPLQFFDHKQVAEAFMNHETRKVDKSAFISVHGDKFETRTSLIGAKVEVTYDPSDLDTVYVSYKGEKPFPAKRVKISSFCEKTPSLPECMLDHTPENSRLLGVIEKQRRDHQELMEKAISFTDYVPKEGNND